jgi:hypothetical protein
MKLRRRLVEFLHYRDGTPGEQVDVDDSHVGLNSSGHVHHVVGTGQVTDHVHVVLGAQDEGQRAAKQGHLLDEQDPDHVVLQNGRGTRTVSSPAHT